MFTIPVEDLFVSYVLTARCSIERDEVFERNEGDDDGERTHPIAV
jgi:hypothetical protein